ncbi:unnamed protein product, partial [Adineta steineri]
IEISSNFMWWVSVEKFTSLNNSIMRCRHGIGPLHIWYVHNGQLDFKVRCELGPLCGRIYSTFPAYKGHIYRQHVDLLNEDLYRKEVQIITNTHDDETLLATNYATQSDFNMQIYDGENEEDKSEEEIDDEDTIRWPLLKETITRSCLWSIKEASTKRLLTYGDIENRLLAFEYGEDIDDETLFSLPQSMMYEIIKPMKDRVHDSQQLLDKHNFNQTTTQSTIMFSSNTQGGGPVLGSTTTSDIIHEEIIISSKEDENKENDVDDEEPTLPSPYIIPDLPLRIQQIIDKGEIGEFRSHTNARRLLLDTIFNDVTTKYSLL